MIVKDLVNEVCVASHLRNYQCLLWTVRVVASAISNMQKIPTRAKQADSAEQIIKDLEQTNTSYQSLCESIKQWLRHELPSKLAWSYSFGVNYEKMELLVGNFLI